MKYKLLRAFIRRKQLQETYNLTGELVIDGKSFFNSSYKNSECQYLLGGEYDRYANHIRKMLKQFSDITCYIIFNGAMQEDIEGRLELHKKKIIEADSIQLRCLNNEYTDVTIFSKMVCRDVIKEFGIKYYVSEYGATEAMVALAKQKRCPILTNNFEMCFYGVACITPSSLRFDEEQNCMTASIYRAENIKRFFKIHHTIIPTFLTISDEDSPAFSVIPLLTDCNPAKSFIFVQCLLRWIQRRTKNDIIDSIHQFIDTKQISEISVCIENKEKIFYSPDKTVIKYLSSDSYGLGYLNNTYDWFAKGVADETIISPFINLKHNGIFSGSWLVSDHGQEDAMLPSLDIVFFAQALLTQSTKVKLTFIGRQAEESHAWEIQKNFDINLPNKAIFKTQTLNMLKIFLNYSLPGFNYSLLRYVPEECWLIIISLVYYTVSRDVIDMAYAVLLSYVVVGPVTQKVGIIRRARIFGTKGSINDEGDNGEDRDINFSLTHKDCLAAADAVTSFFYVKDVERVFDKRILHNLAEFQHCWFMMNGLNRLVGGPVKCTKFHQAYNGTFVYNVILYTRKSSDPLDAVRNLLGNTTVFKLFHKIVTTFEECLLAIKK